MISLFCAGLNAVAGDGKLLATPGVTQFEGAGGGGIVPWAMLSGYATRDEVSGSGFATSLNVDDFKLNVIGAAFNVKDTVELSVARQRLDVEPLSLEIEQDVFGFKWHLAGDMVYTRSPQFALGVQHKRIKDATLPRLLGATEGSGTDVYLAASKLHLGAVRGYNLLWSLTFRATKANQAGLLGFGGDDNNSYKPELEGSIAILLNRHVAVGAEFRTKPDNLSAVPEDNWVDVFVAIFPNKHLNVTIAYADLGNIAGVGDQKGLYLSLTGYLQ